MYARIVRVVAVGFTVALSTATIRAQGPPGMPFPPGGIGGPGGPGGPPLVMVAAVQEDLKITDQQKKKLRTLETAMSQRRRAAFEEGGDPETVKSVMDSLRRQRDAGISKILDRSQKSRLAQIELQREGLLAVARSEIATKLKLSSAQTKKVRAVLEEMRESMARTMPRPPGGGPPPGEGRPGAGGPPPGGEGFAPGGPPPGGEGFPPGGPPPGGEGFGGGPPPGGRPDFNSPENRARFAKLREAMETIRSTANKKVAEVLTEEQQAAFDKMLGRPFDFSKIRMGPGPGGPAGGPPGTDSEGTPTNTRSRRGAQR